MSLTSNRRALAAIIAGVAGVGAAGSYWRRRRRINAAFAEKLDRLVEEIPNPGRLFRAAIFGQAPYKILEEYRFMDGDAFLLGVVDEMGDLSYILAFGLPPMGEEPDFELSARALMEADEAADDGDLKGLEIGLNVKFVGFGVPGDEVERAFVRAVVANLAEEHRRSVENYATSDPQGLLASVEGEWLFASPLRTGRARLAELT